MATTRSLQLDNCYLGPIRMIGTTVAGGLSLRGSHIHGEDGPALQADMATVSGSVLCDEGFTSEGAVLMPGARVGAQVVFQRACLNGCGGPALLADRLACLDIFCDAGFRADGLVSLAYVSVKVLQDDERSWPSSLNVDGLTYDDLQPHLPARKRLQWICRTGHRDQPYQQLASYYRKLGNDDQARIVLLARQRGRRRQQPRRERSWGWLQDAMVGYGYAPGRALAWLVVAFVIGCVYFNAHRPPAVDPTAHPTFNAALYTFNVLLPIPDLGQVSDWNSHGTGLVLTVILQLLGWLLAITIGTAITRSVTRS